MRLRQIALYIVIFVSMLFVGLTYKSHPELILLIAIVSTASYLLGFNDMKRIKEKPEEVNIWDA